MKKKFQKMSVISAALLALTISVNAQWTRNAVTGVTSLTFPTDKVGIGTPSPSFSLDIKQDANCSFRVQSKVNGSSNMILSRSLISTNCLVNYKTGLTDLWFTGCINNNDFRLRNAASVDVLYANQAGNIGIGTTTPLFKLDIQGSSSFAQVKGTSSWAGLVIDKAAASDNGYVVHRTAGFDKWVEGTIGNDNFCIRNWPLGTNALTVDAVNNYIGIGTAAPAYLVDVQGDVAGSSFYNIYSKTNFVGTGSDLRAYYGYSRPAAGWGYGAEFTGGFYGSYSVCDNGAYGAGYGAYGSSFGTTGTQYGVYGTAIGGTTNWGVYSAGATYSTSGYSSSDAKLKKDVRVIDNALAKINQLQPRTYTFKTDEYKYMGLPSEQQYGFIAQELETVFPEMVKEVQQPIDNDYKKNGMLTFKAINYTEIIPVLTQAIQEQQKQIESQNAEIESLKAAISNCCNTQPSQKTLGAELQLVNTLFQNTPNPFNQTTVIRYALNSENASGKIIIRDLNGNLVKQINIANSGKGQVTINANELAAGTYTYTLEIAGASVDTKLMVVTK